MSGLLLLSMSAASAAEPPGREIYVARCQACHGAQGKGDGPAAGALPKKPRDFSDREYWSSTTDAQVRAVITNGLPGTIMRGFVLPADQLDALVAYLRSFAP